MITQMKDFAKNTGDMSPYDRPCEAHLPTITRIVGVCTAIGEFGLLILHLLTRTFHLPDVQSR